jgi:tetratricopeptide (TPR) repeat protein
LEGDYSAARDEQLRAAAMPDYAAIGPISRRRVALEMGLLHETSRASSYFALLQQPTGYFRQVLAGIEDIRIAAGFEAWPRVLALKAKLETLVGPQLQLPYSKVFANETLLRQVWPYAARALAHTGDIAGAEALIGKTPLDCIVCLRARAEIAAVRKDWRSAEEWLALASKQAPSIPTIDNDWGKVLLAQGGTAAAIAKFTSAHKKGPHFADPLEGWGEALMLQNRSDLALAKFAEANKYAPNWGRLHLEWGEALSYTGDHIGAQKQFLTAARLDLSSSDKAALEHWIKHG